MHIPGIQFSRFCSVTLALALALSGAFAATATAQTTAAGATQDSPAVDAASGVAYLNGGIDNDSQEQMRKQAHDWPLRMTFSAQANNAFAANVRLAVVDKQGKSVLQLDSAGPLTYVRLSPGEYRVTASYEGKEQTRTVHVGEKSSDVNFHWE